MKVSKEHREILTRAIGAVVSRPDWDQFLLTCQTAEYPILAALLGAYSVSQSSELREESPELALTSEEIASFEGYSEAHMLTAIKHSLRKHGVVSLLF